MGKIATTGWDILDHLKTESDMALYLEAALEDDDPTMVAVALGDIARAKGMTRIAEQTGLGRESLYKALSSQGNPQLATVLKVVDALGFRLCVKTRLRTNSKRKYTRSRTQGGENGRPAAPSPAKIAERLRTSRT